MARFIVVDTKGRAKEISNLSELLKKTRTHKCYSLVVDKEHLGEVGDPILWIVENKDNNSSYEALNETVIPKYLKFLAE